MMYYKNLFPLLLLVLSFSSCDLDLVPDIPAPREVSFTFDILMELDGGGCDKPCPVNFNNTSSSAIEDFLWDYGDGSISNDRIAENPTYEEYGSYIIKLTGFAANGDTIGSATATVNVRDPLADPEPSFEVSNEGCFAPCTISFNNTTTVGTAERYIWDFGDGSSPLETTLAVEQMHTYTKSGTYTVVLTAFNGTKSETFPQNIVVNIWTAEAPLSGAGGGKAIFQTGDHEYLMVGNTGSSSGSPFLKKVTAAPDGSIQAATTIIIEEEMNMRVADAVMLEDSSIAIIGFDNTIEPFRNLYLRVGFEGNVLTGPLFLPEEGTLDDWNMTPTRIVELPSDNRLLIVGNAERSDPFKNEAYYRVFNRTAIQIAQTRLVETAATENTFANQISGNGNGWAIGFVRQDAGSNVQAELLVTDTEGNPQSGFPRVLNADLETINLVSMLGNQVYWAGKNQLGNVYLAKAGLSSSSVPTVANLSFSATLRDMTTLQQPDRLLMTGRRDSKAFFMTFTTELILQTNSEAFGSGLNSTFNAALQSNDCGFAACGTSGDSETLFFVKTDENGQIP